MLIGTVVGQKPTFPPLLPTSPRPQLPKGSDNYIAVFFSSKEARCRALASLLVLHYNSIEKPPKLISIISGIHEA